MAEACTMLIIVIIFWYNSSASSVRHLQYTYRRLTKTRLRYKMNKIFASSTPVSPASKEKFLIFSKFFGRQMLDSALKCKKMPYRISSRAHWEKIWCWVFYKSLQITSSQFPWSPPWWKVLVEQFGGVAHEFVDFFIKGWNLGEFSLFRVWKGEICWDSLVKHLSNWPTYPMISL